jgi:hypothetical protein
MKIIISESQLKQIIESEEKKTKLYNIPAEDFLENYQAIIDTYNRKNKYDGIELDGYLYLVGHEVSELEKIFQHVVEVDGDIMLELTNLKSLGRLKKVSGNLNLFGSQIEDLGDLEEVGGYLDLYNANLTSLNNLKKVGKDLRLTSSLIQDLNNLESVGGELDLLRTSIVSLGKLKTVGGNIRLNDAQKLKKLENLKYIGLDGYFDYSAIEDLGVLKKVGGSLFLQNSKIKSLGNLESVRMYLYIFGTPIESLGELKSVGLTFDLRFTRNLETLGNLEYVGSDLRTHGSLISKFSDEEILSKVKIDGEIFR